MVRAVRTLTAVAAEVGLLGPPEALGRARELCAGLPVCELRRIEDGEVVVLHEAIRPLAPSALARAVLDAALAGAPAAVPVLPLTDTVKRAVGGELRTGPERAGLRVVQSPAAFRAYGSTGPDDVPRGALDLVARRCAAGRAVHTVPGDPAAFALRSAWDLELAEMVLDGVVA